MASVNKVIIIGHVGRDPEVRHTDSVAICNLSVATSRKLKTGAEETEWHRVVLFNKSAEVAEKYLRKGSQVYIEGRLRTRKYTGKDGTEKYQTEILSDTFQMLGRADGAEPRPAPASKADPVVEAFGADEVPF